MEQGKIIKVYIKNSKEIIIRYPELGDFEDLMSVLQDWYKERVAKGRRKDTIVDEKVKEWWLKALAGLDKESVNLVAEVDGQVRGFVAMQKNSGNNYSHVASIGFILVIEDYRGRDIAWSLLTSAITELKQKDGWHIELIELRTDSDNAAAQSLYRKCGFREVGRITKHRKFISGEFVDSVIMAKSLSE